MSERASHSVRDGVAVITLDNPPVNGLGLALRQDIMDNLQAAAADDAVKAVVIIGSARAFSGGADIREFNTESFSARPNLPELGEALDLMTKPLVAAIGGFALGGGLELALACHYRVAAPKAQLGLPEVKLGILPGAGGTQRLPRLIPVSEALQMMLTGVSIPSERGKELGLIDEVVQGDLLEDALAFARRIATEEKGPRRTRDAAARIDVDPATYFDRMRVEMAALSKSQPSPLEIVACVEAATALPFEEGLAEERRRVERLIGTTAAKAMMHAFLSERAASKIPDVPEDTKTRDVRQVGIIGAGTMGGGIAMAFANAGLPVTLVEAKQDALDRGLATIRKNYAATVAKGRLAQDEMDRRMSRLTGTLTYDAVRDADLVVEAVFEDMGVKEAVFKKLDAQMKPGAILATNTSTLDVDKIAACTKRPGDVIGTHFFSPAHVMRLLEVVRGAATSKEVLATVMRLSKTIKKVGVVSGVCDGFIGNRMLEEYLRQALFLVEEGASPQAVDQALVAWGLAMGPFAMLDMAGQDVGWHIRKRRRAEDPAGQIYPAWLDRICEQGRFGQKVGKGVYRYEAGNRTPVPDPEIDRLIADYSKEVSVPRRAVSDEEIVERCMYALTNEGAKILDEKIAQRASDIDVVYVTGYGFPVYRGGPMFYADSVGLKQVVAVMEKYSKGRNGQFFKPAALLARLAAEGRTFNQAA